MAVEMHGQKVKKIHVKSDKSLHDFPSLPDMCEEMHASTCIQTCTQRISTLPVQADPIEKHGDDVLWTLARDLMSAVCGGTGHCVSNVPATDALCHNAHSKDEARVATRQEMSS